jgi:murein DD-endopeptidase MepM/ murein hydrolase activator NlpD
VRELPETPIQSSRGTIFSSPHVQAVLVLLIAVGIAVFFLNRNQQPDQQISAFPAAIQPSPSPIPDWRLALENQLLNAATAEPTQIILPTNTPTNTPFPTATSQIVDPDQVEGSPFPTRTPGPTGIPQPTVQSRGATPVPSPTGAAIADAGGSSIGEFQPPAESIPLSLQPNDHFFMKRPVDATANGESLFYYPYGSGTTVGGDILQVHHGIDIPNPVGERVIAAADGTVIFSGRSSSPNATDRIGELEVYPAYGEMIVIQHDFYFEGQPVWTLYAHMSALVVQQGDRVRMGDTIGLVGQTGYVTGAHVHFEVRIGVNSYWNTRNPLLWIAPYLNHGVVAGRVVDRDGNFIDSALLQINRGGRRVDTTTTYEQPREPDIRERGHVGPDDNWNENFVFGDVPAGEYEVVLLVEGRRSTQSITVRPGMVNFVEFQIDPPETTPVPIDESAPGN